MRVEIALIILLTLASVTHSTSQVDNLNLLLPQLKDSSRQLPLQLITAQGACYIWASSAPQVLSVTLHDNKSSTCSKQALVKVVTPGPYSSSIYVTASDPAIDSILNVPVRIRKLNKIFIATKSRMMNLKEIQKIQLFAQDSEENTFTSLEGLRFTWTLEQRSKIIQTVPLANAQLYLPLRTRQNLEKQGYQSDILVVRALAPGNLKIYVRCIEPGYEHLRDQITLSVHQRFELKPGPILRILSSSSHQLRLERPNTQIITLPQPYYNIISCKGFEINSTLYLTVSQWSQKCEVKIEDTRTIPPYSSTVTVLVQNPVDLRIVTEPVIIIGRKSPFQVQYFNANHQLIYGIPSKLIIESDFTISILNSTIQANRKKVGWIKASLNDLRSQLQITSLLPITPLLPSNYIHLPLNQVFKLRMLGGSGVYEYNINNEVASVNNLGLIVSKNIGQAKIKVSDRNYPSNHVIIDLKVSDLAELNSLEQQKEANKEQWVNLYLIGKSKNGEVFTQCLNSQYSLTLPSHKLQIDKKNNFTESIRFLSNHPSRLVQQALYPTSLLKGKSEDIIKKLTIYVESREIERMDLTNYINSLQNYGICHVIKFKSSLALQDRVSVNLLAKDSKVETKVPLRVYEHIATNIKGDMNNFLLTPLSSLTWDYSGGSYSWPNSQTKITINQAKVVKDVKPSIVCPNTQQAATSYDLKIQNEQTPLLLFPTYQRTQINVACKFPKKLQLQLQNGNFFDEILINSNTQISGSVQPFDENDSPFFNSTNAVYNFIASNGAIENKDTHFKYSTKKRSDKVKIYTQNLKENLHFPRAEVQFEVSVVEPFKIDHLLYDSTKQTPKQDDIKKNIQIITLYTPKKPYILYLTNASPLIELQCSDSVSCEEDTGKILVHLQKAGKGVVSLKDKRVYGSIEWIFQFTIVQPEEIRIQGSQDYIAQGESVNITLNMLFNGKIISPLLYQHNHLELAIDNSFRILQHSQNRFLISANTAGKYDIHGAQTYPRSMRSVTPFVLNVYQRIEPDISNIISRKEANVYILQGETAIVFGCRRILRVKGGPKSLQASFENDRQLTVSPQSYNTFSITGQREGSYNLKITVKHNGQILAICSLKVFISKVESVELTSIDQPVIHSQFRIIPKFKVGKSQIQGCVCDFDYKWSTEKGLIGLGHSSSLGFLQGGGINATALKEGSEILSLVIQDKGSRKIIGQAQRSIKVIKEIDILLPTLIAQPYSKTEVLRISPLTSYSFGPQHTLQGSQDIFKIHSDTGSIQTYKKLGHSTLKITRNGYAAQLLEIEVANIAGIFIENDQGSLTVQPGQIQEIPLYFYDNNGRLFITPMKNLQVHVSSSNPDVLKVSLSSSQKHLIIEGVSIGSSQLSVNLLGKNVYDSIAVSVGSLIKPSSEVKVLKGGVIKFKLPGSSSGKWVSSQAKVVSIHERTGVANAYSVGRCKITNGNLFAWVTVTQITTIQQIHFTQPSQGHYTIIYRALWNGKKGEQQIPNFNSDDSINNNFRPSCVIHNSKWYQVTSEIKSDSTGYQRLYCYVKVIGSVVAKDFPSSYPLSIVSNSGKQLAKFNYASEYGFLIDGGKTELILTSSRPKQQIKIRTKQPLNVQVASQYRKWVKSTFNEGDKMQTISFDMGGEKEEKVWWIEVGNGELREKVSIAYRFVGEQAGHNFLSLSLDWPEYLIILMAIVFGILCIIQYYSEDKKDKSY